MVRVDFVPARRDLHVGLFGTARITVAQHRDVLIVPASAILRDDITGVARAALITPDGVVRWVEVKTAARQGDALEVSGPELQAGTRVIVSGHVGLPEGTRIRVEL
jgi:multidrug efflux pump subunit AcrA (membrane-fusion protein)